jgi:hypothetical protein
MVHRTLTSYLSCLKMVQRTGLGQFPILLQVRRTILLATTIPLQPTVAKESQKHVKMEPAQSGILSPPASPSALQETLQYSALPAVNMEAQTAEARIFIKSELPDTAPLPTGSSNLRRTQHTPPPILEHMINHPACRQPFIHPKDFR